MKVAIVDDGLYVVINMQKVVREAGHEVLGICISFRKDERVLCIDEDLDKVAEKIKEFRPDVVFLDHDLSLGSDRNGEALAKKLGLPWEKLVGISSGNPQRYCGKNLPVEKTNVGIDTQCDQRFLEFIG